MSDIKQGLLDAVTNFESVQKTVSQSLQKASKYDITGASTVSSLVSKLNEMKKHHPKPTNTELSYIPKPVLPFVFGECETWQELTQIKVPFAPVGVTYGANDEIGVTGYGNACIVSKSGMLVSTLNLKLEYQDGRAIAFSRENKYFITDYTAQRCCKYDNKGHLLSYIHPLDKQGNPSFSSTVHVDSNGCICWGK